MKLALARQLDVLFQKMFKMLFLLNTIQNLRCRLNVYGFINTTCITEFPCDAL